MLRAGAVRSASLSGLQRAGALRAATRSARDAGRGLFGACTGTGGPQPQGISVEQPAPGAAENADAVRNALTGRQLLDLSSTANSSTRNTTRFCPGNRADRSEEFNGSSGFFPNDLTGTWAVLGAIRQADGTLAADVAFNADDSSFDLRAISIAIAPDGTVRRPAASASELQPGGDCTAARPDGRAENDTAAARSAAAQQLTGRRVDGGGAATDFCSGTRAVHREAGAVVLDGSWTLEWAASDAQGVVATMTLRAGSASRRLLVVLPASGQAQVQDLGAGTEARPATLGPAAC
jgi:hypothetical protein